MRVKLVCLIAAIALRVAGVTADEPWPTLADIPPGYMIVEGDLVVPVDYFEQRATFVNDRFWTNGIVPYIFDPDVTELDRARMRVAMNQWEAAANVHFVDRTDQVDFLYIRNSVFNSSEGVGPAGGQHDINIATWFSNGVLLHELGHALAFYHEQSRTDRDLYVRIEWNNISQTQCDGSCTPQFTTRPLSGKFGPYDYGSIMHYGQCDFTCCRFQDSCRPPGTLCPAADCRTITTLDPAMQTVIGQRDGLSFLDKFVMRGLYPFSGDRFYDRASVSPYHSGLTIRTPFNSTYDFREALLETPDHGTLFVLQPGTYNLGGAAVIVTPRTIAAPLGGVVIRP